MTLAWVDGGLLFNSLRFYSFVSKLSIKKLVLFYFKALGEYSKNSSSLYFGSSFVLSFKTIFGVLYLFFLSLII